MPFTEVQVTGVQVEGWSGNQDLVDQQHLQTAPRVGETLAQGPWSWSSPSLSAPLLRKGPSHCPENSDPPAPVLVWAVVSSQICGHRGAWETSAGGRC